MSHNYYKNIQNCITNRRSHSITFNEWIVFECLYLNEQSAALLVAVLHKCLKNEEVKYEREKKIFDDGISSIFLKIFAEFKNSFHKLIYWQVTWVFVEIKKFIKEAMLDDDVMISFVTMWGICGVQFKKNHRIQYGTNMLQKWNAHPHIPKFYYDSPLKICIDFSRFKRRNRRCVNEECIDSC